MVLICQQCNCSFERDRKRTFCSTACAYEFRKGKPQDPEFIARRSAAMKGIKKSPEHVAKMAAITKAKWDNGEYSRDRTFTEEHKKNLAIAAQNRAGVNKEAKGGGKQVSKNWPPLMWTKVDIKPLIWKACPCGNRFLQKDSRQEYCCFKCSCEFKKPFTDKHKKNLSLNAQKRADKAKVSFICEHCGIEAVLMASMARKKKYCSVECSDEALRKPRTERIATIDNSERMKGKNNPAFTHPETFKYKGCRFYSDLGLRLRSGWEANVARILREMGLDFEYESRTFLLSDGSTYTPDFYIPELDETIEVKGRWMGDSKEKVQKFMVEYPEVNLNIIGPVEYKQLVKEYNHAVA